MAKKRNDKNPSESHSKYTSFCVYRTKNVKFMHFSTKDAKYIRNSSYVYRNINLTVSEAYSENFFKKPLKKSVLLKFGYSISSQA